LVANPCKPVLPTWKVGADASRRLAPLLCPGGAGLRLARRTGWQKCFDTSRAIVFLMRDRKMNTAFTNLQKPMRVNGNTPLWQRCGLGIGIAGSGS